MAPRAHRYLLPLIVLLAGLVSLPFSRAQPAQRQARRMPAEMPEAQPVVVPLLLSPGAGLVRDGRCEVSRATTS